MKLHGKKRKTSQRRNTTTKKKDQRKNTVTKKSRHQKRNKLMKVMLKTAMLKLKKRTRKAATAVNMMNTEGKSGALKVKIGTGTTKKIKKLIRRVYPTTPTLKIYSIRTRWQRMRMNLIVSMIGKGCI